MSLDHNELLELIPPHASEDLRQDLFVALADAEPASAEAARIIIQRTIYRADWAKHQSKVRGNQLDSEELTADVSDQPVTATVAYLLDLLDSDERELVRLRYIEEMPASLVAAKFGISQPTLRKRLAAALEKIRKKAA